LEITIIIRERERWRKGEGEMRRRYSGGKILCFTKHGVTLIKD
jgi:hypothetical protein